MKKDDGKAKRIRLLYESIQQDSLYRTAAMGKVFVPGAGLIRNNPITLVGEAPGEEEERQQKPFVGRAGKNLDCLLAGVGLTREIIFVTNLLKYRPISQKGTNRTPSAREIRNARLYLLEELKILTPRITVCLGLSAARALLGETGIKMSEVHNQIFQKHSFTIFVTYHPSPFNYMIPNKRRAMEEAFNRLKGYSF